MLGESFTEISGPSAQVAGVLGRGLGVVVGCAGGCGVQMVQQVGTGQRCLIGVALDFGKSNGPFSQCAVSPLNGVPGVFPPLVRQPMPGAVDVINEPVTVASRMSPLRQEYLGRRCLTRWTGSSMLWLTAPAPPACA